MEVATESMTYVNLEFQINVRGTEGYGEARHSIVAEFVRSQATCRPAYMTCW